MLQSCFSVLPTKLRTWFPTEDRNKFSICYISICWNYSTSKVLDCTESSSLQIKIRVTNSTFCPSSYKWQQQWGGGVLNSPRAKPYLWVSLLLFFFLSAWPHFDDDGKWQREKRSSKLRPLLFQFTYNLAIQLWHLKKLPKSWKHSHHRFLHFLNMNKVSEMSLIELRGKWKTSSSLSKTHVAPLSSSKTKES